MKSVLMLVFLPILSYAENRIGLGFGMFQSKDNLSPSASGYLSHLRGPEDTHLSAVPLLDLQLTFKGDGNTYFFRSSPETQSPSL
ncbi:MAG: hypothetical protein NZ851_01945 [Aquificaceae bacterium]|nr:hypothetical protein [Aquificaceae bacterium]